MMKDPLPFLRNILGDLKETGIDLSGHFIDHLCYRTTSQENYIEIKNHFEDYGALLVESEVGGRLIATYKLNNPVTFKCWVVPLIEVPAPKAGKVTIEGYEHIEVVIDSSFEEFMRNQSHLKFKTKALAKDFNPEIEIILPSGSVKFHHQSLEEVIKIEKQSK